MSHAFRGLLAASLLFVAGCVDVAAQPPNKKGIPMKESIIDVVEAMTAAFHQKDLERVLASYEPGAVVAFEPGKPEHGDAALRAGFEASFVIDPKFSYAGHEVLVAGDIAVHFAPWTMVGKAPDGTPIEQRGLSVAVLRRQPNGRWLMVIDNPHGAHLMDAGSGS